MRLKVKLLKKKKLESYLKISENCLLKHQRTFQRMKSMCQKILYFKYHSKYCIKVAENQKTESMAKRNGKVFKWLKKIMANFSEKYEAENRPKKAANGPFGA